ncbi:catalase [Alteromonadaceae bacterium 2753L.S.0a.02]|nr:catalase [Alteromonadaceae bacterium 2753L.S.0a.02]
MRVHRNRLLCIAAFGCSAVLTSSYAESPVGQIDKLGMSISDQEEQAIIKAIGYGREISKNAEKINGAPFRRDAHAKATGCLRATFTVNGDIPDHFRASVFAQPAREYPAWIRFSNGDMTVQPDKKPDARGMAIKVMQVSGEPIAAELPGPATQDFVMTNMPVFFHRNIFDYVDDMKYLAKLHRTRWFISFFPPRLHPKRLLLATETVSAKINNPLQPQYYSMTPYRLGDIALKFSARPCDGMTFYNTVDTGNTDYLTTAMQQSLKNNAACFDFMVQERKPGANMPLDDATVEWSQQESPFIPIAKIHIPSQTFNTKAQNSFCENLSMNPWNGVDAWEPLGSLNRSRRLVYYAVSQYRHKENKQTIFQPGSWCIDGGTNCDLSEVLHRNSSAPVIKKMFDPLYTPVATTPSENK